MEQKNKPRIACCAIVKNEEEILERMINSVRFMVDKFIIFDTGSTDSTKEIIKKYGDLYETPFENFVDTKNKVLETVDSMDDIDYILWCDADEELKENPDKLLEWVLKDEFDFIDTNICDITQNDEKTIQYSRKRIWKNHHFKDGWRFRGPMVHEYMDINSQNGIYDKSIVVWHKHKSTGKNYQEMFIFYEELLTNNLVNNPKDTRGWFYLARTYKDMQHWEKAIKTYEQYLRVCDDVNYHWRDEVYQSIFDIATCYEVMKNIPKCIEYLERAIKIDPRRAEAYLTLSKHYFYIENIKDVKKAKHFAKEAFRPIPSDVILFLDTKYYYEYPLDLLALICWELKEWDEGLDYIDKLLKSNSLDEESKTRLVQNKKFYLQKKQQQKNQLRISGPKYHTIDNYFDKIFVINLRQRIDRWEKCKKRLDMFGITKAEQYYGVNGDILAPLTDPNIYVRRTGGYLGCLLSHLDIIWQAKHNNWANVLILEDDIKIYNNLQPAFHDIIVDLEKYYPKWDVLHLGHGTFDGHYDIDKDKNMEYKVTIEHYDKHVIKAHNSWALHAYAVNARFYDVMLDFYKDKFELEIDRWFLDQIQNKQSDKYTSLIAYPQLFLQEETFSDNFKGMGANHDNFVNTIYSKSEDYI